MHKYYGYFIVFTVQLAVITGIMRRTHIGMNDQPKRIALVILNVIFFFGPLIFWEIRHQIRLRNPSALKSDLNLESMSRIEFDTHIANGRKLVVLDNYVLDLGEFISVHPGGKFVINHSIGSDVSKFFFGGYNLEGNLGQITPGHNHSAYARMIVNELAIAHFEKDIPIEINTVCLRSESKSRIHAPDIKVIHF